MNEEYSKSEVPIHYAIEQLNSAIKCVLRCAESEPLNSNLTAAINYERLKEHPEFAAIYKGLFDLVMEIKRAKANKA